MMSTSNGQANVPGEKTYTGPNVLPRAMGVLIGQLGAFAGIFFGSLSTSAPAWWSFCFFGTAFAQVNGILATTPVKISNTSTSIILINWYGQTIREIPASAIASVSIQKNCWNFDYVRIEFTDGYYQQQRSESRVCKCCVQKTCGFFVNEVEEFVNDYREQAARSSP
eukprot:gnl/TRDRNA2_/TRDRNA2_193116_c0_seq1.p2 gnl/TRDRNA2_/TRDRNA2_193116_c0~~gnl/TRDRNA2_/TRDRNA2_193116_c0_seq1.p2  ORF type:complete len:167 (+),score=24.54 gnl/TRDRNA2_/TRDRNA2_193116_c0_seq1:97-597(+)